MKRAVVVIGIVAVLLLAAQLTNAFLHRGKDPADVEQTAPVVRRDIGSSVLATGVIRPMVGAEVKVGSRISGVVKHLRANIGDVVASAQIVAELDDAELRSRLEQNFASLAKAQADLDLARAEVVRTRALLEQQITSRQQADQAEGAFRVAEAQLNIAAANVDYAKVQLSYTRIQAPIAGVVASISTQEGETVSASLSAPTFVSIIALDRLEVNAYVDETDIGKIHAGQQASFTVDTYPETDFAGTVTAIYPKAVIQDNVVNYIVTITIDDFQRKTLRPEMTTNVTVRLETRENVLAVPTTAVRREGGQRAVTVVDGAVRAQRTVTVGWQADGFIEVVGGLDEGELVLVPERN